MSDVEKAALATDLGISVKELTRKTPDQIERLKQMKEKQAEADVTNASKTGIGKRVMVGQTRGKGALVISYENWDESKPETLPTTIKSFLEAATLDPSKDEAEIVSRLIKGDNDILYVSASDPLAEYVEDYWPTEAQNAFRLVVRTYARNLNKDVEDVVNLIKPGFDIQYPRK